jgi:hypothetical protein
MDNGCGNQDLFSIFRQLANESDRGAVIVSAALLDDALLNMLKQRLCPSLEREDELFERIYAPLGTFAAKIDLAYRVGLINAEFRRILHLMRKLRNDFAHSVHNVDFNEPAVQRRLRELFRLNREIIVAMWEDLSDMPDEKSPQIRDAMEKVKTGSPMEDMFAFVGQRKVFDYLFGSIGWSLSRRCEHIEPIRPD